MTDNSILIFIEDYLIILGNLTFLTIIVFLILGW